MLELDDNHPSTDASDPTTLNRTAREPRALPGFVSDRMRAHAERMRAWNGHHLMHGRHVEHGDLVLTSNDYLALAKHPDIIDAEIGALRAHGKGAMMSGIFIQDGDPMRVLEARLASDLGAASAMLAQSGWCANVGLIQAIADERTPVYVDHLGHASLWEGVRSAGARGVPVHHNDPAHMERQVLRHGPGVIAVDAIYSITGALCPIADYVAIARAHDCVLLVDESHSLGTHGAHGEGVVASLGLAEEVDFVTASLAKTYVGRAGLITCRLDFNEYFASTSLPAIFSSTLLPHDVAGIAAAHRVIRDESWRRTRLHAISQNVRRELLAAGYPLLNGSEQVLGLEIGTENDTIAVRDIFEANGIVGSVFCAPATPSKRSLLRLTLNAGMTANEVERLVKTMVRIRAEVRLDQWTSSRRMARGVYSDHSRQLAA